MSVPDVGIKYMTAISTTDGVYVLGITKTKMVSYKTAFQGKNHCILWECLTQRVSQSDIRLLYRATRLMTMSLLFPCAL